MRKQCKRLCLLVLLGMMFALLAEDLYAQPPGTRWTRTYGGKWTDHGQCIQQTSDGGYIIAGYSDSFSPTVGDYNFYLIKTDVNGDTVWHRAYGGSQDDRARCVRQTHDGGYILAGYTYSFGQGDSDVYLVKTDANGVAVWTRTYGGSGHDEAWSVWQTGDDGYIVGGYTNSFGAGDDAVYLIKTNADGDTTGSAGWAKTYGGAADDYGYSVQQTLDGGYVIAGYTWSFGIGHTDVYLIKTDANGDTCWTRTYGGEGYDLGFSVQQTVPDSGYVITGYTSLTDVPMHDVYLIKTDADGDTLWTRTFGGTRYDQGNTVQQTSDGGYIIGGYTNSFGTDPVDYDFYLLRTSRNGRLRWSKTFGWVGYDDRGQCARQTSDGGYVFVGLTPASPPPWGQVYLIRLERDPRVWYVPEDAPTIQDAIDLAAAGDTVCVAAGRYMEDIEIENFDSLFVLGSCSCGTDTGSVIVDPDTSVAVVRFSNVGPGVRFEGFVLTGGTFGISLYDSDPHIGNVIIHRNDNGVELINSSPRMVNNVIANNIVYGMYLSGTSCPVLNGDIITGNLFGMYGVTSCCVNATYNDVWGNTINFGGACSGHWPPDQNISQDPKYANSSVADYHLCVDSPCIDCGDPDSSECDPDGSRNDMGAYGGPQACQDYPSYAKGLKAVAESTVVGLTWEGNAAPESVSYYIVYRDTALGFVPDATKHYRDVYGTSLTDTIGLNARYAYRIAAVDNHCYQGGYSVSIQAETCPLREGVLTASYSWGCPVENSIRGNVVAEGVGLRGTGTGSIVLTGIPAEAHIVRALLYWDGSPYASLNSVRVGATTVGRDHGVSGYRADVAHVVNGNGNYVVSVDGVSDGASLVVVYEDSTMARRAITINDGLDNEGPGSGGVFDNTYFAYDQQDSVYACYIVGGGSPGLSEAYYYNLQMVAADSADGSGGASWDTDWISIHPLAAKPPPGQFGASAHIVEITDSLNWVAVVNVGLLLPAGVSDRNDAAKHAWALAPIHPNPSGSRMVVEFNVPKDGGKISLVVYDVAGRLVRTLIDGSVSAGRHSVDWDATRDQGMQVSPGIYFIRMEAGSYRATKKVVMLE